MSELCSICAGTGKLLTGENCEICKWTGLGSEETNGLREECLSLQTKLEAEKFLTVNLNKGSQFRTELIMELCDELEQVKKERDAIIVNNLVAEANTKSIHDSVVEERDKLLAFVKAYDKWAITLVCGDGLFHQMTQARQALTTDTGGNDE